MQKIHFLDFAPSTGKIFDVNIPSGPGVRVDTYLYPGCTVSPYYDSLMGKLITWGQNFEEARQRMSLALSDFYIEGVESAIPLYKQFWIVRNSLMEICRLTFLIDSKFLTDYVMI